jgi:hypothetical protein
MTSYVGNSLPTGGQLAKTMRNSSLLPAAVLQQLSRLLNFLQRLEMPQMSDDFPMQRQSWTPAEALWSVSQPPSKLNHSKSARFLVRL